MAVDEASAARTAIGLADVIGRNARRVRTTAGLTLDQVSIAARRRGLKWNESRVADFEAGRVAPNLATLAAFCLALADAGGSGAALPALLASVRPVRINDRLTVRGEDLASLLIGAPVAEVKPLWPPRGASGASSSTLDRREMKVAQTYPAKDLSALKAVGESSGATEERIQKSLGISSALLANLSTAFWKRNFSQERDRRAGEGANAQKRGQITRQMRGEVEAAIKAVEHGDDK